MKIVIIICKHFLKYFSSLYTGGRKTNKGKASQATETEVALQHADADKGVNVSKQNKILSERGRQF